MLNIMDRAIVIKNFSDIELEVFRLFLNRNYYEYESLANIHNEYIVAFSKLIKLDILVEEYCGSVDTTHYFNWIVCEAYNAAYKLFEQGKHLKFKRK